MYAVQRVIAEILLPPFGLTIVLFLACLVATRMPRLGVAVGGSCLLLQFGLGLASANRLLTPELRPVPASVTPPYPQADAIVVLGGGRYLTAPEWGGETAGPSTLERVRYAAKLQRETGLRILVSGGRPGDTGMRTEAEIMRDILEQEFSVPVEWVEGASENTDENARLSAAILRANDVRRILLVTHGQHMDRARSAFEAQGLEVAPMTTGFLQGQHANIYGLTPSFYGLSINRSALYELLARLRPG